MKSFPVNHSGRRKIERAIRNGWTPGERARDFFSRTRRSRRTSRMEAGSLEN
ncbi:MAG TPA: hypothetical protein VMV89_05825 [Candidatus Paceibacterota bacterium]|nr:hypothetical protein [Candidatus Paceibacterota bacterium]